MTTIELARQVAEMRAAQKHYFRTRGQGDLETSKRLERQLDQVITDLIRQPTLFDRQEANP